MPQVIIIALTLFGDRKDICKELAAFVTKGSVCGPGSTCSNSRSECW